MPKHILLICTVGGSLEPLVQSILQATPQRVVFLHSTDSYKTVKDAISELTSYERPLAEGAIIECPLTDPQSLTQCVAEIRSLNKEVAAWTQRSDDHHILVDFTAGTKTMSAALALVAHRWPCRFSYVGGSQRDKDGLGVVKSGSEKVLVSQNPWDAMAYQPLQDAVHLFNHSQPAAAAAFLEPYCKRSDLEPAVKRRLLAVKHLATAYAHWDAFQHQDAVSSFKNLLNATNDLDAAIPNHRLIPGFRNHCDLCQKLAQAEGKPSKELILDLLANADRCAADGRYDDAVARLYRATEALAQLTLQKDHDIDTANCPIIRIPGPLRQQWASRLNSDSIKLALQDAYNLLDAFQHDLGKTFRALKLHERTSPLTARNQSILAHGFDPTTSAAYDALKKPIHQLADSPDLEAFKFPQLPTP